ncbi:MAG: NADH-quinone oxidoreductase subunit L [Candidatus Zixiibacteriota bacterium]
MSYIFDHSWLIPALPFLSFLFVGLFVAPLSRKAAGIVATLSVFASAALALWLAWEYFHLTTTGAERPAFIGWGFEWLRYHEYLSVNAGVLIDASSVLLMVVVTFVGSLIHLYSIGYMADDPGSGRYFTFLNLFTFSMLGLVVAPNILQMFVFWELVGVSSFLLIGYYYQKPSAVAASKKAFIVTRFADLFFLVGVLMLGYYGYQIMETLSASGQTPAGLQAFDFQFLTNPAVSAELANHGVLTAAMVLIFIGAAGKSAMFPLHIWLPDAMEGPTPVSALIHAATMVVAGIYLVARLFPAFAASGTALLVAAYVGAFTCLFAAVIACTQHDIKRVLAFSTLSQLGYMMFALGVATMDNSLGYTAALFHLFTHAFFKALLFLGAGSVIHAIHTNDIREMGGLRERMPVTHMTFLIATLAIAGVPPLAGFFSKDEILAAALGGGHQIIFAVGLLVAGITAFYMFRIYFLSFWGKAKSDSAEEAHEAPTVMLVPLVILALFSIVAGLVPMENYVSVGQLAASHGIEWSIAIPATLLGLSGIALAWVFYAGDKDRAATVTDKLGKSYQVIYQKFYIDEMYLFVTKTILFRFVATPVAWFDRHIVDGAVNLSGFLARFSGSALSRLQTGQLQTYGVWLVNGAVVVALSIWFWMR